MITEYMKFQAKLYPVLPFLFYQRVAEFAIGGLEKNRFLQIRRNQCLPFDLSQQFRIPGFTILSDQSVLKEAVKGNFEALT